MTSMKTNSNTKKAKQSFWQIVMSTCAAAFGVQTDKNRERDFAEGSVKNYIVAGVVFTIIFVVVLVFIVKLVLNRVA